MNLEVGILDQDMQMNENETVFVNHWASLVPGRWLHTLKVFILKALSGFLLAAWWIAHLLELSFQGIFLEFTILCFFLYTLMHVCMLSRFSHVQLFAILWNSPPESSVHGILQAKTLEWVAMPSSRRSSWPRDWTHVSYSSCIAGRFFTTEPSGKLLYTLVNRINQLIRF